MHLRDHWRDICQRLDREESMIKPTWYGEDGRLIAMDYGSSRAKTVRETRSAQGCQYVVKADISNCFPSLYTHSVDWALRGIAVAKANHYSQRDKKSWEEQLDTLLQNIHDGETKGVMTGPAVSNIISELVLQRVDEELRGHPSHPYVFVRYIDDRYELHRNNILKDGGISAESERAWFEQAESWGVRFSVLGAPLTRRKGGNQWRLT
jgi:hypothetical protein